MITHDVTQGTKEWHELRASSDGTASELAAACGKSKYQKRSELLNQKLTGITPDIDANKQRLFDRGHEAEELARAIAEEIIGEDLYPTTATIVIDGLVLLASFDGVTADDSIIFEHKLYNKSLSDDVINGDLEEHYTLQMDQQLLVSGAEKCLFMCSDGTNDNMAWCWYLPEQSKLDNVVRVWGQFRKDLCQHEAAIEAPAVVAEAIIALPSVIVQVKGELSLCNLDDIRPAFDAFLANAATDLVTDEDFARAEAESKISRDTAKKCLATCKGVIDQTASISEVTRELEQYAAKFNASALQQEKLVKSQKEARKLAIMTAAVRYFAEHLRALELEIIPIRLITGQPDFNGAMKNKRLLSAIQDAVDTELARVKIEADGIAKSLRYNLKLYREYPAYFQLFADLQTIIYKPFDDFKLIIESRVEAYKKAENEKLEAQRIAIEAEATRKAEAEQARKLEAERQKVRAEEQAKIDEERRLEQAKIDEERRLEQAKQAKINEVNRLADIERQKVRAEEQAKIDEERRLEQAKQAKIAVSITIPLTEYDTLKADSERLHAIIANWVMAKSMNESALRANDNYTKEKERMAAKEMRQKAIDLIELK